jgi:flagellar motor switch protein FliN
LSRKTDSIEPGPPREQGVPQSPGTAADADPFGWLPRVERKHVRLEGWLARQTGAGRLPPALFWLEEWTSTQIAVARPEVLWRPSGLNRPGLVAQLTAPRLGTRVGIGIETPLAHVIVDRLLGFERQLGESRLQLTPVEWGIWTFLFLRILEALEDSAVADPWPSPGETGALCARDLTLDRVGPDPFDPEGLGAIVTVRWPLRVESVTGAVRLWVAESVVHSWIASAACGPIGEVAASHDSHDRARATQASGRMRHAGLSSLWRAEAGIVAMPQGLTRLRIGGILPLAGSGLTGSPNSPCGPVALILDLDGQGARFRIRTHPLADSGARLLEVEGSPIQEAQPRDPILGILKERSSMSQINPAPDRPGPAAAAGPLDVPVTLTVELGRVNLTLTQLADLKPGDVLELSRHSRAPVDLTSNGRLVARGDLILIDTDLGVRVTSVFL